MLIDISGLLAGSDESIDKHSPFKNKWQIWRAVIAGFILATCIILAYFWVHVQYINPMFVEVFKIHPAVTTTAPATIVNSKIGFFKSSTSPTKSTWVVEYDLPPGIPLIKLNAQDVPAMTEITCPPQKFALALYVENSDSVLAKDWLERCGRNVAYFRFDGNPISSDVDNSIEYFTEGAQYFPLRATLNLQKGEQIEDNPDFQKTLILYDDIKSVEMSGFVTPKTIEELQDAVPYAEELTIKGDDVCKSLRRSMRNSKDICQVSWEDLKKLRIIETQECKGMYDLIFSCWDMPKLQVLQIRKSIITSATANYIKSIIDSHRILKVDFADNVCYDDTLQIFPFMCQPSL